MGIVINYVFLKIRWRCEGVDLNNWSVIIDVHETWKEWTLLATMLTKDTFNSRVHNSYVSKYAQKRDPGISKKSLFLFFTNLAYH